jgi:hypothetical protein
MSKAKKPQPWNAVTAIELTNSGEHDYVLMEIAIGDYVLSEPALIDGDGFTEAVALTMEQAVMLCEALAQAVSAAVEQTGRQTDNEAR